MPLTSGRVVDLPNRFALVLGVSLHKVLQSGILLGPVASEELNLTP